MKKFFTIIAILLFAIWGLYAYQQSQKRTLHFVTMYEYPPYEMLNAQGQLTGFDIDFAKALCKQLDTRCRFSMADWPQVLEGLNDGRYDAVLGALAITKQREKYLDFTNPYNFPSASFVARGQIKLYGSDEQVRQQRIGAVANTSFEHYLKTKYQPHNTIVIFKTAAEVLAGLKSGQINLALLETPVIKQWIQDNPQTNLVILGAPLYDPNFFGPGDAIGVRKGNTALQKELTNALQEILKNGEYAKIFAKYF